MDTIAPFPGFEVEKKPIVAFKGFVVVPPKTQRYEHPPAPDYTSNPKGEGLYEMTGADGKTIQVPYSKVMDASKAGFTVDQKVRERYAKDKNEEYMKFRQAHPLGHDSHYAPAADQSQKLKPGDALPPATDLPTASNPPEAHRAPLSANKALDPVEHQAGLNVIKRVGKNLLGVVDMGPQGYNALKDSLSDDPDVSSQGMEALQSLVPNPSVAVSRVKELKEDWKKSPALAVENVEGDAIGLWLVGKATEGASEGIKRTIPKAARAANFLAKEVVGIRPKVAADAVADTMEKNKTATTEASKANANAAKEHLEKTQDALHKTRGAELEHEAATRAATAKAEEANANAAKEHLEKTQDALHETTGKEIEHQAKVKAEADKAKADHEEAVAKVKEYNDRVTAKHEKVANRIKEENAAADHALELRRQREAELQKETDTYYAKEDAVKAKAKAEENAAWQPWHEKMEGVTVDGGRIAKRLEKVTAVSPDAARALRQLIPDPGDAAPDSLYAQDRKAIMLQNGYPDQTNYWDLPEHKRLDIDKIAASSGFEPEPIDFDPESGKAMPVEQIHRAQSILGKYIRSNRYEGHVLDEMKQVQSALRAELNRVSMEHGALGDLEAARKATQKYNEAFGRERPSPQTIDDLRKKGANPEQYREEEDQARLDAAAKHSQELVDAHEKVKNLRNEVRKMKTEDELRKQIKQVPLPPSIGDLRDGYNLKREPKLPSPPVVEPPARVSPPDRPPIVEPEPVKPPVHKAPPDRPPEVKPEIKQMGEEDLMEANRAQYSKTIQSLRSRGIWYGAALPWLWVARDLISLNFGKAAMNAIGAGVSSVLTVAGLTKLADVLEQPAVRDWVAKPSVAEIRELEKLPPEQRKVIAEGLRKVNVVAKKKGYKVNPLIVAYMAANKGTAKVPGEDEDQKK